MQAPRDSQPAGGNAAPTLFGASPKPVQPGAELRILSALEPAAPAKPRRAKWLLPVAVGAATAGAAVFAWQLNTGSEMAAQPMAVAVARAAASAPTIAASAVADARVQGTSTTVASAAPAASTAAVIETLPQAAEPAASVANASAETMASATAPAASSPLALLAAEDPAASAHAAPAHKHTRTRTPAAAHPKQAHATHVASTHEHHKTTAKAKLKEDADVDLLEAMVAHVRGQPVPAHDK